MEPPTDTRYISRASWLHSIANPTLSNILLLVLIVTLAVDIYFRATPPRELPVRQNFQPQTNDLESQSTFAKNRAVEPAVQPPQRNTSKPASSGKKQISDRIAPSP